MLLDFLPQNVKRAEILCNVEEIYFIKKYVKSFKIILCINCKIFWILFYIFSLIFRFIIFKFSNMAEDFSLQFLSTSLLLFLLLLVLLFNFFDNTKKLYSLIFFTFLFYLFFGSALDSHFFMLYILLIFLFLF